MSQNNQMYRAVDDYPKALNILGQFIDNQGLKLSDEIKDLNDLINKGMLTIGIPEEYTVNNEFSYSMNEKSLALSVKEIHGLLLICKFTEYASVDENKGFLNIMKGGFTLDFELQFSNEAIEWLRGVDHGLPVRQLANAVAEKKIQQW